MKVNSLNIQPILHQQFGIYSRVGSKTWEDYLEKAVRFGVVEIGGSGENDTQATNGQTWVSYKYSIVFRCYILIELWLFCFVDFA